MTNQTFIDWVAPTASSFVAVLGTYLLIRWQMRRQDRDKAKQDNERDGIRLLNAFKDLGLLIVDLEGSPTLKPVSMAYFRGPDLLPEQSTIYRLEDDYIERARQIDRELFALALTGSHPRVRELAQEIIDSTADLQTHLNQGGAHQPDQTLKLTKATMERFNELNQRVRAGWSKELIHYP